MTDLPKPEVIITHESDLDGLVAGVLLQRLAKQIFDTDIPLEAYHYNQWKQRELREKSAWVTDFTFEPRLDKPDWVIIDHHVTEAAPKIRPSHSRREQVRRAALLRALPREWTRFARA